MGGFSGEKIWANCDSELWTLSVGLALAWNIHVDDLKVVIRTLIVRKYFIDETVKSFLGEEKVGENFCLLSKSAREKRCCKSKERQDTEDIENSSFCADLNEWSHIDWFIKGNMISTSNQS